MKLYVGEHLDEIMPVLRGYYRNEISMAEVKNKLSEVSVGVSVYYDGGCDSSDYWMLYSLLDVVDSRPTLDQIFALAVPN